jgi:DnaK suppressor protein
MSAVKKVKAKSIPAKAAKKAAPKPAAPAKAAKKPAPIPKAAAAKQPAPKAQPVKTSPRAKAPADLMAFKNYKPYIMKKGEEYMNDAQEAHFRNILNDWKKELMEEVDRTMHYMKDEAANFPDPNDRASQESDFTLELRARDRERKLIKKIDEALQRLDNHEYGECESCGVEIGIRRLEARPTATLCIDCKTLDEIREKQMGD